MAAAPEILASVMELPNGMITNHGFRHLHTLEVSMQYSFSLRIAPLFYIPSLRRLCLDKLFSSGPDMFQTADWPVPPSTSNIESLGLRDLQYSTTCATKRIASCKLLKSCEIQLDRRSMVDGQDQNGQWIEVMSALQGHSRSLTQLALRDELNFVTECRSESMMLPVSGFRQLQALEDLEIPWSLIMGSLELRLMNSRQVSPYAQRQRTSLVVDA